MNYFIDTATGMPWALEQNVTRRAAADGTLSFFTADGTALALPKTLRACTADEAAAAAQPKLTPAQVLAQNTAARDNLLQQAALQIAPLQDASDLSIATTAEIAALQTWKNYRVAVNRVDLTQVTPQWPALPAIAQ